MGELHDARRGPFWILLTAAYLCSCTPGVTSGDCAAPNFHAAAMAETNELVGYDHGDKPIRVGQEVNLHDWAFGCTERDPVARAWTAHRNNDEKAAFSLSAKSGCFGGANLGNRWVIRDIQPPTVLVEFVAEDSKFPGESTLHPPRHDTSYWVPDYLVAGH